MSVLAVDQKYHVQGVVWICGLQCLLTPPCNRVIHQFYRRVLAAAGPLTLSEGSSAACLGHVESRGGARGVAGEIVFSPSGPQENRI